MADEFEQIGVSESSESDRYTIACEACLTALSDGVSGCPHCGRDQPPGGWTNVATLGDPWLGRVVGERYRLTRLIGRGASGAVYEAESLSIGRSFAVKIIDFTNPGIKDGATRAEARFEREVETLGELRNPHIVSVYELLRPTDDVVAIVMDLVAGRTVHDVVTTDGPLEPGPAADLIRQVANGLHEAHESGIIHRDIKPSNIMVEQLPAGDYFAHILDFGVVYRTGETSELTQGFVGTPLYTSPEQAKGDDIDRRADIYSLGATAFFMLTGRPPFVAETAFEALRAHLQQSAPRLSVESEFAIPPEFDELMARLLSKDPDRRPDTLTTVIQRLNDIERTGMADSEPILAVDAAPGDTRDSTVAAEKALEESSAGEFRRSESRESAVIRPKKIDSSAQPAVDSEVDSLDYDASQVRESTSEADDGLVRVVGRRVIASSIVDVAFTASRIGVLDQDGSIHLASTNGGIERTLDVDGDRNPTAVAVDTDAIFVGDATGRVYRRAVESGELELLFASKSGAETVTLVTCSQGERVIAGFADGDVVLYDMSGRSGGYAYHIPSDVPVTTIALCGNYGGFAVCRADKTVALHSMDAPDVPVVEFEADEVVREAAFSGDAHLLALVGETETLEIYHADSGHRLMPKTKLRRQPLKVIFDESDELAALCEIGGVIHRWSLQDYFLGTQAARGDDDVG
jgi:serine/threonine protein kinase